MTQKRCLHKQSDKVEISPAVGVGRGRRGAWSAWGVVGAGRGGRGAKMALLAVVTSAPLSSGRSPRQNVFRGLVVFAELVFPPLLSTPSIVTGPHEGEHEDCNRKQV